MVSLLFLAVLINYIDRGNLSVTAVPLMKEFSIGPAGMGALLGAFFWTYSLMQIPAGWLVDRFGIRWTYAAGFLLWSLVSAGVGWAHSFTAIFALRLLLGVGEAISAPSTMAYIRRNFSDDQQGLPTAVYLAGMMIGPAFGAFFGGAIITQVGWRLLFIVTGLGALVWLIPWFLCIPPGKGPKAAAPLQAQAMRFPWRRLLASKIFWGLTVGSFFYSYFWYFCVTWVPSYLVMAHGFSFLKMGAYTAVPLLGMAAVSATCGRLADRIIARTGRPLLVRKVFVCTGFILGSSILLLLVTKSSAAVLATLLFSLMGIGVASANFWALTQTASPPGIIGRVIGYQNMIANFAGVAAPMLTGFLVGESKNFHLAIMVAGGALWIAVTMYVLLISEPEVRALQSEFPAA